MTTGMMMTRDPPPLVFEALSGHAGGSLETQSQHISVPLGQDRAGKEMSERSRRARSKHELPFWPGVGELSLDKRLAKLDTYPSAHK